MKKDWDIVADAFESGTPECASCEYFGYDYCSITGADTWCDLGTVTGHDPKWCAAYDRIVKEINEYGG